MVIKGLYCLKKANMLNSETTGKKIKSPFVIYADFKSILILEDNKKQNPNKSYASKYQKVLVVVFDIN